MTSEPKLGPPLRLRRHEAMLSMSRWVAKSYLTRDRRFEIRRTPTGWLVTGYRGGPITVAPHQVLKADTKLLLAAGLGVYGAIFPTRRAALVVLRQVAYPSEPLPSPATAE